MKFSEHRLLFLNLCAGWCSCIGQREEVVWGMLGLSDQTGSVPVREVGGLDFGRPCVEAALLFLPAIPRRVSVANDRWYLWKRDHHLGDLVRFGVFTDQTDLCVFFNSEPTLWMQVFISSSKVHSATIDSIFMHLFLLFWWSSWSCLFHLCRSLASSRQPTSLELKS